MTRITDLDNELKTKHEEMKELLMSYTKWSPKLIIKYLAVELQCDEKTVKAALMSNIVLEDISHQTDFLKEQYPEVFH